MRPWLKRILLIVPFTLVFGVGGVLAEEAKVPVIAKLKPATLTISDIKEINFGNITATGAASIVLDATNGAAQPTQPLKNVTINDGNSGQITVKSPVTSDVSVQYSVKGGDGTGTADRLIADSGSSAEPLIFTGENVGSYSSIKQNGTLKLTAETAQPIDIGGLLEITKVPDASTTYKGIITVTVAYE